jgi:Predicted transcriptional regulators
MPPRSKKNRLPEAVALGKRLHLLREAKGWTLEELAEAAGMNELQVGHIERGATDPKLSTIRKLARAYGMTASELLKPIR